jgi:hypothetical protein
MDEYPRAWILGAGFRMFQMRRGWGGVWRLIGRAPPANCRRQACCIAPHDTTVFPIALFYWLFIIVGN